MKNALPLVVAALAALAAAPAVAQQNNVSGDALSAVGLGGMKVVSEQRGETVRGKFSFAKATSLSYVNGVLFDPHTGSDIKFGGNGFGTSEAFSKKGTAPAIAPAMSLTEANNIDMTTRIEGMEVFRGTVRWNIMGMGIGGGTISP